MTTPTRKGATRRADIPADILAQLNNGTLATATLAEGLAIDFSQLLAAVMPDLPQDAYRLVREARDQGVTRRMELVAAVLLQHCGLDALPRLQHHPSDTVRGWAGFMIGLAPKLKLQERLALIRPLAADSHFGVREWAWMPIRPHLAANVNHAVKKLLPWVAEDDPFLRRFAIESTRPRGVWASHIPAFKQSPELGLPLLEPLQRELDTYVQTSVGNWLNDAGKSQPHWVRALCERWKQAGTHPATEAICRRALRNL